MFPPLPHGAVRCEVHNGVAFFYDQFGTLVGHDIVAIPRLFQCNACKTHITCKVSTFDKPPKQMFDMNTCNPKWVEVPK